MTKQRRNRYFFILLAVLPLQFMILESAAQAQDTFEIQVYEYPTVPKHKWDLEVHFNYIASGTKEFEGSVAPTDNQFHLTYELTRGITDHFEMAGYLVLAQRPGGGFEYAGARVRPRFSLPRSWGLPFDFSLATEFGFPRPQFEANSVTLEIRPVVEKTFESWRLSFNPVIGRALRGPDTGEGFEFEPGAKFAYFLNPKYSVGLEYFANTGPINNTLPIGEQQHLLFPSLDISLSETTVLNFGVGFSLTGVGEKLIPKMRFGYIF